MANLRSSLGLLGPKEQDRCVEIKLRESCFLAQWQKDTKVEKSPSFLLSISHGYRANFSPSQRTIIGRNAGSICIILAPRPASSKSKN